MLIHTIEFVVDWDKFVQGKSFFIPCIDYPKAEKIVRDECKRKKKKVIIKKSIEQGIRGVRVWNVG